MAGAVATTVMTLEEPLDRRIFDTDYSDIEILGKLATRGEEWLPVGVALHVQNGALLGTLYAQLKPFLPGPPPVRGLLFALAEHVLAWPITAVLDRHHPARKELPAMGGNGRVFAQATIRHAVFGIVLGVVEGALNDRSADEPPGVPVSQNGHGNIEHAVAEASA